MINQHDFDVIIVGQGISGSVLAYSLLKERKKIIVIDNPSLSNSSKIAAGISNPVVFKRLTQSWKVDEALPFANDFYKDAGSFFGKKIYFEKSIIRVFSNKNEKDNWLQKAKSDAGEYLSGVTANDEIAGIKNESGYAEVKQSGYLDVLLFLGLTAEYLKKQKLFLEEKFDFGKLRVSSSRVEYGAIKAKRIIFCEGHLAVQNPYFKWLLFKLSKGELVIIKIEKGHFDKIINKDLFILPIGNGLYKVGATYGWENPDETPSEKGRNKLIEKLNALLKVPYEIVDHKAGIRPTVSDRKPLIGLHPEHPLIGIFNGMGTKGVMLAPYFAKQFIDFLECGKPLDAEADIRRFWK